MSAPLFGMSFPSFLILVILSALAAGLVHWAFRFRLFEGVDGFIGQWIVAWVGAWLGPTVLGHWSPLVSGIYVIPGFIGAFAGALAGTINAKVMAGLASRGSGSK